ncbi:MAG: hypothetical protein KatS3mg049_3322 [Caldilinea sp.]|nr:hypothetical protein [Caldilinea sp.]GIV74766.1 MAG: hypothetical protein KatS3mg049_3322 [Caldilinea sp.]
MRNLSYSAVADHQLCLASDNRRHQEGNVGPHVLIVGICVNDNVCTQTQTGIQPRAKGAGQAKIARVAHDMVHTQPSRHLGRAIGAAVIDHQIFQHVDARQGGGQVRHGLRQRLRLVITRNLDDAFQAASPH